MPRNSLSLHIAQIYPDIFQGFCDDFNINTFCARAKWRDIDVTVDRIYSYEKLQSSKYNFLYLGSGNCTSIKYALKCLKRNEESIKTATVSNIPILALDSSYILLGHNCQLNNSVSYKGLGIFNTNSFAGKTNCCGYLAGTCSFLENITMVGYENHSIETVFIKENTKPFLTLSKGFGNNSKDKLEGSRIYNAIGTNIISPILAQNPLLCDFLISQALKVKYKTTVPLEELCDDVEFYSHNHILETK